MPRYAIGKPGGPAHWVECRAKVPAAQIGEGEVAVPYRGRRCRARIAASGRGVVPLEEPGVAATWQEALAALHTSSAPKRSEPQKE